MCGDGSRKTRGTDPTLGKVEVSNMEIRAIALFSMRRRIERWKTALKKNSSVDVRMRFGSWSACWSRGCLMIFA